VADAPVQPSLRRMRQFAVRPDRELGQNFLIDSNILGVIERAGELAPDDVVLEIGCEFGGLPLGAIRAAPETPRPRKPGPADPGANTTIAIVALLVLILAAGFLQFVVHLNP